MTNPDAARMAAFLALPRHAQEAAVRRLAAAGYTAHDISRATSWSTEAVRQVLALTATNLESIRL